MFEVKLRKNASGLGFSFVQMESERCGHLKNDLVRIKRLFPGQPAEENGAIAAGDIILAVNGRPTEGLDFQVGGHEGCSPVCRLRSATLLSGPPTMGNTLGSRKSHVEPGFGLHKERNWQNILTLKFPSQFLTI